VLEHRAGLSASDLRSIAELERRTVAADGGRLKLEWGALHRRRNDQVADLLWWDGDRLTGYLGLYSFGGQDIELAGMVDPASRRRGIASALLDSALRLVDDRGHESALLVCPGATDSGRKFAMNRGAAFDHAEYALVLHGEPVDGPTDVATTLREPSVADSDAVARLLESGFGQDPGDVPAMLATDPAQQLVVEQAGEVIGYVRLSLEGEVGGVYGFVIDPDRRGRGIGRDVLRRVCRQLLGRGARRIGLEVAVENEGALGLYTSLGFERTTTEDYFRLAARSGP
jgi:ribosomal protein S18 acetylase RimI-like enzyme